MGKFQNILVLLLDHNTHLRDGLSDSSWLVHTITPESCYGCSAWTKLIIYFCSVGMHSEKTRKWWNSALTLSHTHILYNTDIENDIKWNPMKAESVLDLMCDQWTRLTVRAEVVNRNTERSETTVELIDFRTIKKRKENSLPRIREHLMWWANRQNSESHRIFSDCCALGAELAIACVLRSTLSRHSVGTWYLLNSSTLENRRQLCC